MYANATFLVLIGSSLLGMLKLTLSPVDPDAPSRANPKAGEWHHRLVVNIPGGDVSKGEEKTQYFGSGPPKGTRKYMHILLVI